ncbi:hypothetical protein [Lacticaseibacillus hulanensis]|nr:hypothetical protein [Lacticaseibacillus hulanensis]
MAKSSLTQLHWTVDDFDKTDYYRLMQILGAREKEDRPIDPGAEFLALHG